MYQRKTINVYSKNQTKTNDMLVQFIFLKDCMIAVAYEGIVVVDFF